MFCKNCGCNLGENDNYCYNCGTKTSDNNEVIDNSERKYEFITAIIGLCLILLPPISITIGSIGLATFKDRRALKISKINIIINCCFIVMMLLLIVFFFCYCLFVLIFEGPNGLFPGGL